MLWRFGAFLGQLKTAALTATRSWVLPDRSGSIVVDGGTASLYPLTVAVTGSKTLALTDAGTRQDCTNAAAATITIPLNATVAIPVGTVIHVTRRTAQNVSIGAVGGVTVQGDGTTALTTPVAVIAGAQLIKTATDTWQILLLPSATGRFTTLSQTTPAQARVNRTAAHSLTAVTTAQKLDYDTIVSQSPAGSISVSGRYTVTAANTGIYLVTALYSGTSSAICTLQLNITLNGTVHRVVAVAPNPTAGGSFFMSGSCQVHLTTANDFVEIAVASNASTNLTSTVGATAMYFDITKIA